MGDNSSRITSIESGAHTFTGIKTFEDDIILESNLRVQGDLLVANTVHMIVSDPIMELGANNQNIGDLGIIMTRHGETGNVAIVYDESQDVLNVGYTLSNAYENTIAMDTANSLTLQVNGALNVGSNIAMNDTASNVIEVSGNVKTDSLFLGNFEVVASQGLSHVTAVSAATNDTVYLNNPTTGLVVDSNVEIGENLTVEGDLEFNGNLTMNTITVQTLFTLDHVVSQGNTTSNTVQFTNPTTSLTATGNVEVGGELSVSGNVEIGTANLFVDTTTGNVGVGTNNPTSKLHVDGNIVTDQGHYINITRDDTTGGPAFGILNTDGSYSGWFGYGSSNKNQLRMVSNNNYPLTFWTSATGSGVERMRIAPDGDVGIGTVNPTCRLDFGNTVKNRIISLYGGSADSSTNFYGFGINSSTLRYNVSSTGDVHKFYGGSTEYGYVNDASGFVSTFTGQHKSFPDESLFGKTSGDLSGLIVSASGEYISINDKVPKKGQGAIQVSEAIPTIKLSTHEKDKKVFGVVSDVEDVQTSERHDHYGAFVSTFKKEPGDARIYVNSIGEGAMWVTDINGPLESGDYITTSNVAGYGQRQDSEFLANYTVAKITMDCDFAPATQPIQIIKKELSNVNYWVETTYSNVTPEEYSNLAEDVRTTTTEIYYSNEDGEITTDEYNTLESNVQSTYTELTRTIHQKISTEESKTEQEGSTLEVRQELMNVLDEHGQLQWEDDPSGATEKAYKIRYLDANGNITDEANAVHIAAFVGCTYHCG